MQIYFPLFNTPSNDSGISHFLFLVIMNVVKTGHTLKEKDLTFIWLWKQKQPKENLPCSNHDPEIIYLDKAKSLLHICRVGIQDTFGYAQTGSHSYSDPATSVGVSVQHDSTKSMESYAPVS